MRLFRPKSLKGPIPAPSNMMVTIVNTALDYLIKGLGVDFIYAYIVAQWPPAAWPILGSIIKNILGAIAQAVDTNAQKIADTLVVRLENDLKNVEYNAAVAQVTKPGATQQEIADGLAAIDRLINMNQ